MIHLPNRFKRDFSPLVFFKKLTVMLLVFVFIVPSTVLSAEKNTNKDNVSGVGVQKTDVPNNNSIPTGNDTPPPLDFIPSSTGNERPIKAEIKPKIKDTDKDTDEDIVLRGEELPNIIAQTTVKSKSREPQLPSSVVDNLTGALVYTYPINIPPGRGYAEPELKLVYNSQDRDLFNLLGMGWSLNIPFIQRINRTGTQNLYSETYFYSVLDGELASTSPTSYVAKIDNGNFNTYTFSSNTWTVHDKSGTLYTFGTSTGARQDDPADSSRVYKWMLQEVRDTNGNYIRYEYYKENGQIYPSKIFYTGHDTTDGIHEIEFIRESRDDLMTSYAPSFKFDNQYRISEIRIKVNNQLSRKYVFSYTVAANGINSLLSKITETGYDDNSQLQTLADVDFEYQEAEKEYPLDTTWWFPEAIVYDTPLGYLSGGTHVVDINGDSLPDVTRSMILHASTTVINRVHLNTGNGWATSTSWASPEPYAKGRDDVGTRMVDINGDQLPDVIRSHDDSVNISVVYLNTGSQWMATTTWVLPPPYFIRNNSGDMGVRIADINGDGLPDILKALYDDEPYSVYLNTGTGWTATLNWDIPTFFNTETEDTGGGRFYDVNGDGLTDLSYCNEDGPTNIVFLNTGTSWVEAPYDLQTCFVDYNDLDNGGRLIDISDDGLPENIFSNNSFWYNRGEGWTSENEPSGIPWEFTNGSSEIGARMADVDGDGLDDQVFGRDGIRAVYIRSGKRDAVLSRITNAQGGTVDIEYKTSAEYRTVGGALKNPDMPILLETVNTITYDDTLSDERTYEYSFEGGEYYFNNPRDRKFAGFNIVESTDPAGNLTKTYFHQGNTSASSTGEHDDHISKIGKPYRVEKYDDNENLYSKTINTWAREDLGNDASFVKLASTVEFSYDGDSDHKEKAETYSYDNATGNVTQKIDWGQVNGSDDGTFVDLVGDKFVTDWSYATSSGAPYIYAPSHEKVTDENDDKVREKKIYYDTLSHGLISNGNPTKEEFWKTGSSYIDTEKTYNSYGLVTQEKDPRDKTTTYSYDQYSLYPSTTTNALGHVTVAEYDYSSGRAKKMTDPNGYVFETVFDGLDRVIEEKQPDIATPSTLVTKATYEYVDSGPLPRSVHKRSYLNSATSTDSYTYLDGFGRVIQERVEAEDSNVFSVKDVEYNSIGKIARESLPYFSTGASSTAATTTDELFIEYEYDPLYRVTSIENAVGETTNAYDDWKLTVTDANGEIKHLYRDTRGNLIRVQEKNGGSTYTTEYEYDGNNNLIRIADALGNERGFTYDGLGRRISATDLHGPSDSYYGTWFYAYDDAGNLASSTDPNSQNIVYAYDDLNRMTVENHTGAAGNEVTLGYDSCVGGKGRLCFATSTAQVLSNEYNPLGGIKKETKKVKSANYVNQYLYDRLGNITKITHPDSSSTNNTYNSAGQLEKIAWSDPLASSTPIVDDIDYSPHGLIAYQQNHNGTETTNTYDPEEMYRLSNKFTETPEEIFQNVSYTYDSVGNITNITENATTSAYRSVAYQYDDLHRLTRASSTNAGSDYLETYTYNAIGNITNKSDQGAYSYEGDIGSNFANPHAVTSIASNSLSYDKSGNLLSFAGQTNTWDYQNRLKSTSGTATTSYTYDHSGERVTYVVGTGLTATTTTYLSKFYDFSGDINTKHLYAGDTLVATIETGPSDEIGFMGMGEGFGGGMGEESFGCCQEISFTVNIPHYVHTDHLMGTNVVTDKHGELEETLDYYPFGGIRIDETTGSFDERNKFTGHDYDAETDLNYMGARYQDGARGQFLSQDPVFWEVGLTQDGVTVLIDPQQQNSYSYGRNNPLRYTDPNGRNVWDFTLGAFNALVSNNIAGAGRVPSNYYSGNQTHYGYGQAIGDLASMVQGAGEMIFGSGVAAGGATLSIVTGGSLAVAGAPAAAAGAGIATHGTLVAGMGIYNLSEFNPNNSNKTNGPYISEARRNHVINNHTVNGNNSAGKSIFNEGENIDQLINDAYQNSQPVLQRHGTYKQTYDFGRNIGFDRNTNRQTSEATVITDRGGNLVTFHPGR